MAHKRIATTLIAACLATTCLSYGAFASDPSLYFYPAQKWTVNAQSAGETEGATCSLSNRFNNGFGIILTGDSSGLKSIDIDFRQPSFEARKPYEVVFSVPGQAREVIAANARTNSVLSSDISSRKDFSQALESAATLDLSIQGNEFRLYLTGLAKGLESYQDCIAPPPALSASIDEVENPPELASGAEEAITPVPVEEIITAVAPDPAERSHSSDGALLDSPDEEIVSIESADAEESAITEDKGDIVAKAASLADNYEASRTPASSEPEPFFPDDEPVVQGEASAFFDAENAARKEEGGPAPLPALEEPKREPGKRPQDRPRFTEKLQDQINESSETFRESDQSASSDNKESAANVASPGEEADAAAATDVDSIITAPKPEPVHKSVSIPAYKMTKQTSSMEADFTDVGQQPQQQAAAQPAPTPAPEQDAQTLQKMAMASAAIEPSSGHPDEDFIQMRNKISDLEAEVSRLSKENAALDGDLKASLRDAEEERLSVSSDNWNLERATMRFNEAERQIQRLGRQLQAARQQCTSEKQKLETMLFDPQVTEQQQLAKLASLEEQLAKSKSELQSAQRRYEERIRLLEGQLGAQ